jgi:predicted DNA binding CopG/RHH family protein
MPVKMKKAMELPDMSQWSDEKIEKWLETHDTSEILKKAIMEQKTLDPAKGQTKKHISLRIEPAYIDLAKNIASRKGIGHQTLMRSLIVEGLVRETKKNA